MAPRRDYTRVNVISAHVKSNDERSILVEAGGFTPMRWFLEHGSQLCNDLDEPPLKKRRLAGEEVSIQQQQTENVENIPLFEIVIDLHFSNDLKLWDAKQNHVNDVDFLESSALPVTLLQVGTEDDQTRLCIACPDKKSPVLIVDCTTLPESTLQLLQSMGPSRSIPTLRRPTGNSYPASVLACALMRSLTPSSTIVRLQVILSWKSGFSAFVAGVPVGHKKVYPDYNSLLQAFPDYSRDQTDCSEPWSPQDFYESVHVPAKDIHIGTTIQENILQNELYPFQKRALVWMLSREGVNQELQALSPELQQEQSLSLYESRVDLRGRECWVNFLEGIVTYEPQTDRSVRVSGGLLAEEMGLGKTVELLSLISLHTRKPKSTLEDDAAEIEGLAIPSRATLIITPPSILQQWKSELHRHAPNLLVYHYEGVTSSHQKSASEQSLLDDLATKYDVVLATYQTLAKEVHFAEDPPKRDMRHKPRHKRKRSPLIQIEWWRICLDEAQMVESGVTAAARVACRLPRIHSWAVSGTPLRKNIQDLHGLLIFLRYWPFNESAKLWSHLITNHRHIFRQIFSQIALRHTKAHVREELRLPPQKRVVVTVPFSVIEQQNYSNLFEQMCEDVGVTTSGSPKDGLWNPSDSTTIESMRSWLVRLRQTCLHPQVGGRNRRALGRGQGPLRTVDEVLHVMIEQNETHLRSEERAVLGSSLHRAHIVGNNGEDERRSEKALEIYQTAMVASADILKEARARLSTATITEAERGITVFETDDEDSSSESSPVLGRLRNQLRTILQLHHVCTFFTATAFYQIKTNEVLTRPESEEFQKLEESETQMYENAKVLRKELLEQPARKAEASMHKIKTLKGSDSFTRMPALKDLDHMGGIQSRRIVEASHELFDVIRQQVETIYAWRAKMAEFLLKPLVDEDEGIETNGDAYEDSTKQQDELYTYFDAFKAIHADLHTAITGESAPLIDHEAKTLLVNARRTLDPKTLEEHKIFVHAPELAIELLTRRNDLRRRNDGAGSIRGIIQEARAIEGSMQWNDQTNHRADAERSIVQRYLTHLQSTFTSYSKALDGLEKEVELFRTTQNQRVEFYRQLQELSDAVSPYRPELDPTLDVRALEAATHKEQQQRNTLALLKTKNRFLTHLRDDTDAQADSRICVICQSSFDNGVLTVCGHQYCKECIQHWFQQSRSCPVCKRRLNNVDMHAITYKPQEIKAQEEMQTGEGSPKQVANHITPTQGSSLYSDVDSRLMDEIKSIDLPTSYGTKIDTLGRHLHWIRANDPGAKSIVFSQYREFLDVLGTALSDFKIGHIRLGRAGAAEKFRNDPSTDCLLLDAKTDSSGLTLVNATHVFICEPLIQTAVELQAIARVHRIGQTRSTSIWMYLINDTVEEAIYEISVARRLAHVQSRSRELRQSSDVALPHTDNTASLQENAIDAANSEELQSAPLTKLLVAGKGGGEMVGNEDLWQCLFGKAQAADVKIDVQREVDRHLRAEAAEQRRDEAT